MSDFKWKHFKGDIILGCVRWYCKYGISYRDLEEMMLERGVEVDHTTLVFLLQCPMITNPLIVAKTVFIDLKPRVGLISRFNLP